MKTRTVLRLLIPCVCFAGAWIVTRAVHHGTLTGKPVIQMNTAQVRKQTTGSPKKRAEEIAAALKSMPSGKWRTAWETFASSASEEELISTATGEPGMAKNLAWEELAERCPDKLRALLPQVADEPALIDAAASALTAHDAEAGMKFARDTGTDAAAFATVAWSAPDSAQEYLEKRSPGETKRSRPDSPGFHAIASAWTRRAPKEAAAAGFLDSYMWVRVDAIGALENLVSIDSADASDSPRPQLWMISAALRQSPEAALQLIADHLVLREACEDAPNHSYGGSWLTRWYSISAGSCLSAVEAAASKSPSMRPALLHTIASISPDAAAAVAQRFPDFDLATWREQYPAPASWLDPALDFDPVAAADALLSALKKQPPEEAMATAGLTAHQAKALAELLAAQLPEKARALAATVTREIYDAQPDAFPFVTRYVMDFVSPTQLSPVPGTTSRLLSYRGIVAMLSSDPARYSTTSDPAGSDGWGAYNIVLNWAPHDLSAASTWVRSLPASLPKQRAEAALAFELAVQNPAAGLAAIAEMPEAILSSIGGDAAAGVWLQALHHIVLSGGDWKSWKARTPTPLRNLVNQLAGDALETDAKLLAILKRAP